MKLVIGVTLYNSSDIVERTLASIMSQTYKNFVCYITDDLSTDNSVDVVENFIKDDDRFNLIRNTKKRYQGGNYDLICRDTKGVDDEDIFIEVDGDDWLPDSKVFERVVNHYNSGDIFRFFIRNKKLCNPKKYFIYCQPFKDLENFLMEKYKN